jgi:hypothetical protein
MCDKRSEISTRRVRAEGLAKVPVPLGSFGDDNGGVGFLLRNHHAFGAEQSDTAGAEQGETADEGDVVTCNCRQR